MSAPADYFAGLPKPCCSSAVYHANLAGPQPYFTCDVHDRMRELEIEAAKERSLSQTYLRRIHDALDRARGLAKQNKELKRSDHQLHVQWQREIDNRIKGEGLRAKVRALEAELAKASRIVEQVTGVNNKNVARAEKAEAELAKKNELIEEFEVGHRYKGIPLAAWTQLKDRAEKTEAEVADWKDCAEGFQQERDALKAEKKQWERHIASAEEWRLEAEGLKAEVERLRKTVHFTQTKESLTSAQPHSFPSELTKGRETEDHRGDGREDRHECPLHGTEKCSCDQDGIGTHHFCREPGTKPQISWLRGGRESGRVANKSPQLPDQEQTDASTETEGKGRLRGGPVPASPAHLHGPECEALFPDANDEHWTAGG